MTLEERIKELKKKSNPKSGHIDDWHFGYQECIEDFRPIIQELQKEANKYEHLWETNAEESNEIIAELKAENEKLKEVLDNQLAINTRLARLINKGEE